MKPNILLLCSDQMRPFELGCYGNTQVKTPNLDRLAAMGVRFEHATTCNPVCTAARSAMLSGQYSRSCIGLLGCCSEPVSVRCGFPETTLAEQLKSDGYRTGLTGKWHVGPRPEVLGFDEVWYPLVPHSNTFQVYFDGERHGELVREFAPDREVERSQAFISKESDQPWFLFHNFSLPHMPFYDVPEKYRTMYDPDMLDLRPNVEVDGEVYFDDEVFKIYLFDHHCTVKNMTPYLTLPEGYDLRRLYAEYCGMITCVDDQLGLILDTLEATGQMENTVILFTADHGENMGSHHLWNKVSVNEEALRVPLIIAQPGQVKPGVITEQVASLVDIAPTLLSMAGQEIPEMMQGGNLADQVYGGKELVRDGAAFCENLMGELAIRTPTHIYAGLTETSDPGPERVWTDEGFLFTDLRSDPYQLTPTSASDAQSEIRDTLMQRVKKWDRETPWFAGTQGGVYGKGPQHDIQPPRKRYR